MKKIFCKEMLKTWIVTIVAMVVAIVGIVIMPDTIPTHFGPSGAPDDWGSKYTVLMYPGILLLTSILAVPMIKMDPKKKNYERFSKYYYDFFFVFALFFTAMEIANVAIAVGVDVNMGTVACFMAGVLMVFIGNMMPKIKQNYFFGIRTPWALNDEENWFKTHRMGGKTFAVGGVAIMAATIIPGEAKAWIFLPLILAMTGIPLVYSYLLFKRKQDEK